MLLYFTMPYFLLVCYRLHGKNIPIIFSCLIGLSAGIGFAIKPFFLTAPILVEIYYLLKHRTLKAWLRPEIICMALGFVVQFVPGTYRPLANKDNDYLMDRAAQKAGRTFSGVAGIAMQDASLQESMGPIVDRTKENLVGTDNGIIMARHRMLKAIKAMGEGVTPPGIDTAHQRVRSAAVVLPADKPFVDGAGEALTVRQGVAHATV